MQVITYEDALLRLNDPTGQQIGLWLLRGDLDGNYEIVLTADIGPQRHHT